MKKHIKDLVTGLLAGICIYFVDMHLPSRYFELIFFSLIVLGSILSVVAILCKKINMISVIIRFCVLSISYSISVIFGGTLGFYRWIAYSLKMDIDSPGSNGVSGLMSLTFVSVVFLTCVITIVIVAVKDGVRRLKKKG